MIENKEVSFVFQGRFDRSAAENVNTIINNFPGSKVIISCWSIDEVPENLQDNDCVKVVYTNDIEPPVIEGAKINNINRQLLSTDKGLNKVSTKYSCKIRSDCSLKNNNLLKIYGELKGINHGALSFEQRILTTTLTSHRGDSKEKLLFHPCDWFYFGLTSDLKKLFSAPLMEDEDFDHYKSGNYRVVFRAEQYYYVMHLRNKGIKTISHALDYSDELASKSIMYLMRDFILAEPSTLALISTKHPKLWVPRLHTYSFDFWCKENNLPYTFRLYERVINKVLRLLVWTKSLFPNV